MSKWSERIAAVINRARARLGLTSGVAVGTAVAALASMPSASSARGVSNAPTAPPNAAAVTITRFADKFVLYQVHQGTDSAAALRKRLRATQDTLREARRVLRATRDSLLAARQQGAGTSSPPPPSAPLPIYTPRNHYSHSSHSSHSSHRSGGWV